MNKNEKKECADGPGHQGICICTYVIHYTLGIILSTTDKTTPIIKFICGLPYSPVKSRVK